VPHRRRRLLLGLVIPLLLALTAYVVIHYAKAVYAVLWPGLANGTTVTVSGLGTTSWGYYMGFGKMRLDVSTAGSVTVYVMPLSLYTFVASFNLSNVGSPVDTGYGVYYPCGPYGLIRYWTGVVPVEVSMYQGLYVYVPTDAQKIPPQCYSQWAGDISSYPILTFDGTPHMNVLNEVYVKAYTYDPAQGLVPISRKLYNLHAAWYWSPGAAYGSYGNTFVDGVWYLQLVAVYVTNISTDVTLTATAVE